MTEVQVQPALASNASQDERKILEDRLDGLLEQYLQTLDQYQKTQKQLAAYLSSGYLSLAQANFNNNSHSRYGQDYYDQRMQASRTINISGDDLNVTFKLSVSQEQDATIEGSGPAKSSQEDDSPAEEKKKSTDPLRWFGILIPPPLRAAQASFVEAAEGPIPHLASLVKRLRRQEIEIGRVRKQIKKL
ncbi:hypothetical protein P154DRAFT_517204 [Amniculicola lignicola CBS 123094]|uniref:Vacuolar ATPase assembly protein VMA22 n=1 Tax=Amniculicola lignicola CBS 123094 TaxID=1392246 RepID=A0A6A5X3M3_9PLEO|nr:hypothetical protein P154DRAFT_517204 [Amniculicola lignicola CBS 123094]